MSTDTASQDPSRVQLRLWPGVLLVALQWFLRFLLPELVPSTLPYGMLGSLACFLLIIAWWLFFSRAKGRERWLTIPLVALVALAIFFLLDPSIAGGMMGFLYPFFVVPGICLAWVLWAAFCNRWGFDWTEGRRRLALVLALVLACGFWTLVRTGGFTGDVDHDWAWRWAPTPEERMLAEAENETLVELPPTAFEPGESEEPETPEVDENDAPTEASEEESERSEPATEMEAEPEIALHAPEWPGFRGPEGDGAVHGTQIATDWSTTPPTELWRRPIGPGWSSFVVDGPVFYTQEQRGELETVSCYTLATGEPVWRHGDEARFWESNAGAGPRGTPVLARGRVYTLGGTGLVNALDARTGEEAWSRNAAEDLGTSLPTWAYSGSPVVVGDRLIVGVSSELVAYHADTGEQLWTVKDPAGGDGYASPQLAVLDGVPQVLFSRASGVISVDPASGEELWQHEWSGYPIIQPAVTPDGDVLINANERSGLRRLSPTLGPDGAWSVEEVWTTIRLKPYFNDYVLHEGHAYGFDGSILAAIDLEKGERQWKGGRYGQGQVILLADQDVLLVLGESGELALVRAVPDGFEEVALFEGALDGKTWNHPVLVGDVLLVRNAEEMAAYRLR